MSQPPSARLDMSDVQELKLKRFTDHRGSLVPLEAQKDIPFEIRRIFHVTPSAAQTTRGEHGHYRCSQALICLKGSVLVKVQDGSASREFRLDTPDRVLIIPPTLWAEELYETEDTVLLVLCDRPFEDDDYISDFGEFSELRRTLLPKS